jgi:hypothetical protein
MNLNVILGGWQFDPRRDGFVYVLETGEESVFHAHALYPSADVSKYPVYRATPGDTQG